MVEELLALKGKIKPLLIKIHLPPSVMLTNHMKHEIYTRKCTSLCLPV